MNHLRDSGATIIGIQESSKHKYTVEHVVCHIFSGKKEKYPLVWVNMG